MFFRSLEMESCSLLGVDDVVILPNTIQDLRDIFPETRSQQNIFTPKQEIVQRYSIHALQIGRPLDSAIILMSGETGSGKSTTINVFFEDMELCKTSDFASETSKIKTLEKTLTITAENSAVQGQICFVDIPGHLDTDSNDAVNLARIRKFRNNFERLAERKRSIYHDDVSIPKKVYPNIILFLVSASDERMGGGNSSLVKSLKAFNLTSDLIDYERNNVIVVLTHALSLGIDSKIFQEELKKKTKIIQQQFNIYLKLSNVMVVPVENKPKKFRLKKDEDFYKLPDGQFSHMNLFEAMKHCLDVADDVLGAVLIQNFISNRSEKPVKATVKEFGYVTDEYGLEIANVSPTNLFTGSNVLDENEPATCLFNFQSMGRGFCPITETVKPVHPFRNLGPTRKVDIGNSKFLIPSRINVTQDTGSKYRRLTFLERSEYQNHKKAEYGIHGNTGFVFQGNSEGRWLKNKDLTQESSELLLRHEIQIARFSLDNHREIELDIYLKRDLESLPEEYDPEQYSAFFSRWGTHFIHDETVGGALQMKCSISKNATRNEELNSIDANISTIFDALCTVGADHNVSRTLTELRMLGVSNEALEYTGGISPLLQTLENSKPEEIAKWAKSVYLKPVELIGSIKITPYYDLMGFGKKFLTLKKATEKYLSGELNPAMRSTSRFKKAFISFFAFISKTLFGCFPHKSHA